jgi:saccharopine dehydrogenase-like NADP-dependent oxidoreductase
MLLSKSTGSISKQVLVLGGGKQGLLLASLLSEASINVTVADIAKPNLPENINYQYLDAEDLNGSYRSILASFFKKNFDLLVCCLPGRFGATCHKFCAEFGIHLVDMSFGLSNVSELNSLAQINNCTIVPDVGLAPGLPSIVLGHWIYQLGQGEKLEPVEICVGGVADSPSINALGYIESFSIEDLYQEYTRPARYITNGKIDTIPDPVTNYKKLIKSHNLFDCEMESIPTDGVRTILSLSHIAPNVIERTLRWSGHYAEVFNILNKFGYDEISFVENFRMLLTKFNNEDKKDRVIFNMTSGNKAFRFTLAGTEQNSAMSISTAGAAAAVIMAMYEKQSMIPAGVVNPEVLGSKPEFYETFYQYYKNILLTFGNYVKVT